MEMAATNPPDGAKSATGREAMSESTCRGCPGLIGRARTEGMVRNLGGPTWRERSGDTQKVEALWLRIAACGERGVSGRARAPPPQAVWSAATPAGNT